MYSFNQVLTRLVEKCLGDRPHHAVNLDDKNSVGLRAFWRGLGSLAVSGVELNLPALSEGYRLPDAPVEAKPFEIMITGFNHDRPYPPETGNRYLASTFSHAPRRPRCRRTCTRSRSTRTVGIRS